MSVGEWAFELAVDSAAGAERSERLLTTVPMAEGSTDLDFFGLLMALQNELVSER